MKKLSHQREEKEKKKQKWDEIRVIGVEKKKMKTKEKNRNGRGKNQGRRREVGGSSDRQRGRTQVAGVEGKLLAWKATASLCREIEGGLWSWKIGCSCCVGAKEPVKNGLKNKWAGLWAFALF